MGGGLLLRGWFHFTPFILMKEMYVNLMLNYFDFSAKYFWLPEDFMLCYNRNTQQHHGTNSMQRRGRLCALS